MQFAVFLVAFVLMLAGATGLLGLFAWWYARGWERP